MDIEEYMYDEKAIKEAMQWKEKHGGEITVLKVGQVIWGIEKRMFVCRTHVTQGLKVIVTPHVQKLTKEASFQCSWCQARADFRLYHFVSFSKNELVKEK